MFNKGRFIIVIFFITGFVLNAQAAKVYGTIYEFSDFEKPLKNAIVEIEANSTRVQYNVSGNGTYFFDISPGTYIIKARYYNNNILELSVEDRFKIDQSDESRNLDLILFPPTDSEYEYLGDINLTGEIETKRPDYTNYILIISGFFFHIHSSLFRYTEEKRKSSYF